MDQRDTNKYARALIIMAKRPAAGQIKTWLSPPLSAEDAAALYECFLLDTIDPVQSVPQVQPVTAYLPAGEES
jgi:glycosyltransferase A (GT-A) superfamily protein (DUF2064 family)